MKPFLISYRVIDDHDLRYLLVYAATEDNAVEYVEHLMTPAGREIYDVESKTRL